MTIHHSDTITKLMGALLKVQGQVDGVAKTKKNPHFGAKYATLESVVDTLREPCQEAGLVIIQAPGECIEGTIAITTMIAHAESGEWLRSTIQLPLAKNDPQGAGSAITYGLRYSLMAVFVLPPVEDDDGNAASQRPVQRQQPVRTPEYPPTVKDRPAQAVASPGGIATAMLRDVSARATLVALDKMTNSERWKADFQTLPEADRRTVMNAVAERQGQLSSVRMAG